jgi:hypothetical protein
MGPWEEVGQAQSPIAGEQSSFEVTTLVPGDGPVVMPGDLVKAKLTVTTVDSHGSTRNNPDPQVIWVWTGRTPQPVTGQDAGTYGELGGERLWRAPPQGIAPFRLARHLMRDALASDVCEPHSI